MLHNEKGGIGSAPFAKDWNYYIPQSLTDN